MPSFIPFHYFLMLVIGQGVFLALTLFTLKKGDKVANRQLAAVVILMTHFTFVFFVNDSGLKAEIGKLFLTGFSIVPLIPVMIFFYLKRLTGQAIDKRKTYIHFIPFIIQFLYWLPNNTNGFLGTIDMSVLDPYYPYFVVRIGSAVHIVLFILYAHLCLRKIDLHSSTVAKRKWIAVIQKLYLIMSAIFIVGTLSLWLTDSQLARYIFFSFLALFIYLIGYYGYAQSDILFEVGQRINKNKYGTSGLSSEESLLLYTKFQKTIEEEKLFLHSDIRIADIASKMNVSQHDLSRSINENFGGSFLKFINKYRVEAAKHILRSESTPPKMFAVALDSGFSNKVSFYKNFKKFTGSLPSEFINRL